jgi:hypothetical protein
MNQRDDSRKKKLLANRKAAKITGAFGFLSHTSLMTQPEIERGICERDGLRLAWRRRVKTKS